MLDDDDDEACKLKQCTNWASFSFKMPKTPQDSSKKLNSGGYIRLGLEWKVLEAEGEQTLV